MASSTLSEVSSMFNSQPHIDGIREGLVGTREHMSDKYTFMLRHKHFDLLPGEVLFVEKLKNGYDINVKNGDELDENCSACMWLYDDGWKAYGYTKAELGYLDAPDIGEGRYNLGARWLNNGMTECTDEENRVQWVRPDEIDGGEPITTHVNWEESSECVVLGCYMTTCRKNGNFHYKPYHYKKHVMRKGW